MQIKESAENYLETILVLNNRNGFCRGIDISNEMGFSKPSVSIYLKNLREDGYITVDENGNVHLTKSGTAIAERVYDRHNVIAGFLMQLGTSEETAYKDSCKIEHDISEESFLLIKAEYLKNKEK